MANQRVDISQLSLPELQELHQQLSQEVESFTTNMMALQQTAGRFASAGQSIEALKEREKGQPVLLPMTESLYVSGTLDSVDTVLLEIGTGYYIEVRLYF
jgi:prefoldin alpha subunit